MNKNDKCLEVVNKYVDYINSDFVTLPYDEGCVIVTPFNYPDMASIEIYVSQFNDAFLLSDEGETLNMLFVNGLSVETNKHLQATVQRIAKKHRVEIKDSVLSIMTKDEVIGDASHRLLLAIQAVGYLLYKRRHTSRLNFDGRVEEFLIEREVKYSSNYVIHGKATENKVRFHMNSNKKILLEPITATTVTSARKKAKLVAYKWMDISYVRSDFRFISIIDDRDKRSEVWSDEEALNAITQHSSDVIRWTEELPLLGDIVTR